jgi:KRAB domain-containing zinc finger protein
MRRHIIIHQEDRELPCSVCLLVFKRQDLLDGHIKRVHGEKKVMCPTCGKLFCTVQIMKDHHKSCGDKIYSCSECEQKFSSRGSRSDHVRKVHRGMVFPCACGKTYASRQSLFKHRETDKCGLAKPSAKKRLVDPNNPPARKKYPCEQCDKVYFSREGRKEHMDSVHKGMIYRCKCGRTYSSYSSLRDHMKRDCGKEYKCDQCHMTFQTMKERFSHKLEVHNGSVYHCDCGKTYWRLSTLNVHKQSGKCTARVETFF